MVHSSYMWNFVNGLLTILAAVGMGWSLADKHLFTAAIYGVLGFIFYKTLEKSVFRDRE